MKIEIVFIIITGTIQILGVITAFVRIYTRQEKINVQINSNLQELSNKVKQLESSHEDLISLKLNQGRILEKLEYMEKSITEIKDKL